MTICVSIFYYLWYSLFQSIIFTSCINFRRIDDTRNTFTDIRTVINLLKSDFIDISIHIDQVIFR